MYPCQQTDTTVCLPMDYQSFDEKKSYSCTDQSICVIRH